MIPLRITVQNFGAISHADIDLSNISLVAICGSNGAGKSSLFTIAPMFALFGATKNGCSADDMVRTGTQEMAVTFDFEHRGVTYRAIRTRSKKGKGKSTLELQHLVEGQWISESGTTIRETDEKIRALINLDEETFAASSMILQGKANEFSAKPPGQRKTVLGQILGLEVYDRLLERAREKERAASIALEKAKTKLAGLDVKLQAKAQLETDLAGVEIEQQSVSADIQAKDTELREVERLVAQLMAKVERAKELQLQIEDLAGEVTARQQEQQKLQEQLERANMMLEAEPQILTKVAELEKVKQQVAELKAKQPRLVEAQAEGNRLSSDLQKEVATSRRLTPQIEAIEATLANKEALKLAALDYQKAQADLTAIDVLGEQWVKLDGQVREAANAIDRAVFEFETRRQALEKELDTLRNKAAMLENSGCIDPELASCLFLADAQEAKSRAATVQADLRNLDATETDQLEQVKQVWRSLRDKCAALGYDPAKRQQLKNLVTTLQPKAEQAAQLSSKDELLQVLESQKRQADEQREILAERLDAVKVTISGLTEEIKELPILELRVPKLESWAKAKEELPAARQLAATAKERIEALTQEIESKEIRGRQLEQGRQALLDEAGKVAGFKATAEELRVNLKQLQERQNNLHARIGSLQAQLEALKKAEEERQLVAADMAPLARELVRWQTLVKAFGRDGIPALIIENAVPELERIANEILGQMSKGEHSLKFETQRDLKSKAGVAETLDIIVSDWDGERPYETFSGGEQLRIDFAIRFALAELLARRAGSRVEWLTVDEGLGSQDAEHRTLVLEAIRAVADRFRKTLVITHIEEAKSFFEQVIYVEPSEARPGPR